MAILGYEQHEGDVGNDPKVKDDVCAIAGEDRVSFHAMIHRGTTEEADDVRHQEEHDVHGNLALT